MKRTLRCAYTPLKTPLKIFLVTICLVLGIFFGLKNLNLVEDTWLPLHGSPRDVRSEHSLTTNTTSKENKVAISNTQFSIGTNLAALVYWSTEIPFKDLLRLSPPWFGQTTTVWNTNEKLDLDANGWVKSLQPNQGHKYTSAANAIPSPLTSYPSSKKVVVLYDGEGVIEYRLGAKKDETASKPGRDVLILNEQTMTLKITKTNPNNYIRNVRILPIEYENDYKTDIFNPKFIEKIKPFKTLRFMDWMMTNNSSQKEWQDRPKFSNATWHAIGAPIEIMVALANKTNSNPWFTIPHQATDDYVRQFAQYVKANLKPGLKVYVEYSNEVWNGSFQQSKWVEAQGIEAFKNNPKLKGKEKLAWYSKRTTEIVGIFNQVFFTQKERVIGVMAAQAAVTGTGQYALTYPWSDGKKTHSDYGIKAIAIAPYFGGYLGSPAYQSQVEAWTKDPDKGLNKLFQELTVGGLRESKQSALAETYSWISAYSDLAKKEGLELVAYEGGSHLAGGRGVENNLAITTLFHQANRDERMGDLYKQYLSKWKSSGGGLFNHFNDISLYSKWGAWGALESVNQVSSPRYNALIKLIKQSNR